MSTPSAPQARVSNESLLKKGIDPRDPFGNEAQGGVSAAGASAVDTEKVAKQIHVRIVTRGGERNDVAATCPLHEVPLMRARLALRAGGTLTITGGWLDPRHKQFEQHDMDGKYLEKEVRRLESTYNKIKIGDTQYDLLDEVYGNWRGMCQKMYEMAEDWDGIKDSSAFWESLLARHLPNIKSYSPMGDTLEIDTSILDGLPQVGKRLDEKTPHQGIDANKIIRKKNDEVVTSEQIEDYLKLGDQKPAPVALPAVGAGTPYDTSNIVIDEEDSENEGGMADFADGGGDIEASDVYDSALVEVLTQHDGDQPPMHEQDAITVASYMSKTDVRGMPDKVLLGLHSPIMTDQQINDLQHRIDGYESAVNPDTHTEPSAE